MSLTHQQWKSDHPIYRRFSPGTKKFLQDKGENVLEWLFDSHRLLEQFKASNDFSDYSFTIAPAYKALEKWLLLLAPSLGVDEKTIQEAQKKGKLGLFLYDDKVDKFFDAALERLNIEAVRKSELRTFVQSLHSTLKHFRHNPAHSGTILVDVLQAETDYFTLLNIMDNVTQTLIDDGVVL